MYNSEPQLPHWPFLWPWLCNKACLGHKQSFTSSADDVWTAGIKLGMTKPLSQPCLQPSSFLSPVSLHSHGSTEAVLFLLKYFSIILMSFYILLNVITLKCQGLRRSLRVLLCSDEMYLFFSRIERHRHISNLFSNRTQGWKKPFFW